MRHLLLIILLIGVASTFLGQKYKPSQRIDIDDGLLRNTVTAIGEDELGRILIGTPAGLQSFNGYRLSLIEGVQEHVLDIFHAPDSSCYYVCTLKAIYQFHSQGKPSNKLRFDKPSFSQFEGWEGSQMRFKLEEGMVLISADLSEYELKSADEINDGQLRSSLLSGAVLPESIPTEFLELVEDQHHQGVLQIDDSRWFITKSNGLHEVLLDSNKVIQHQIHWPEKRFQSCYKDRRGNVWIGTVSDGLWMIHANSLNIDFIPTIDEKEGLNHPAWTIFTSSNNLYCATAQGIIALTEKADEKLIDAFEGMSCLTGISVGEMVLVGTASDGIYRYSDNQLNHVYSNESNPLDNTTVQFFQTNEKVIALTKSSLIEFTLTGDLINSTALKRLGIEGYVMHLRSNDDGFIAATTKGVCFLDKDFHLLKFIESQESSVFTCTIEYNDSIWCSALQGGLFYILGDTLINDRFIDNDVLSMSVIGDKMLLMSSSALYIRHPTTVAQLDFRDGIPIKEFNQGGMHVDDHEFINLAGVEGCVRFRLEDLSPSVPSPNLEWRAINVESVINDQILLSSNQNALVLRFESIYPPSDHRFEYQLHHSDEVVELNQMQEVLVPVEDESELSILIIDKMKCAPPNAEEGLKLYVQKEQAIWFRWWFIGLILFSAASIVFVAISILRLRRQKRLTRLEEEHKRISEERLRISRDLHDNIGARLSHIISSLDIEMYKDDQQKDILAPINMFARETMGQLRETIWAVSDRSITISEFQSRVERYLDQAGKGFSGTLEIYTSIDSDIDLSPSQTINAFRIIQEGVNNAVKYSNGDTIRVILKEMQQRISISIFDNGSSFNEQAVNDGSGMNGMKRRAQEINGEMTYTKDNTGFTLSISFQTEQSK